MFRRTNEEILKILAAAFFSRFDLTETFIVSTVWLDYMDIEAAFLVFWDVVASYESNGFQSVFFRKIFISYLHCPCKLIKL